MAMQLMMLNQQLQWKDAKSCLEMDSNQEEREAGKKPPGGGWWWRTEVDGSLLEPHLYVA